MAKNALFADRTREIGIRLTFVAGREIIGLATLVVRDRGSKKMPSEIDEITAGVLTGANHVIDAIFRFISAVLPGLPEPCRRRGHCDRAALRADAAVRLLSCASQGTCHGGTGKTLHFRRVAVQATVGAFGLNREGKCGRI